MNLRHLLSRFLYTVPFACSVALVCGTFAAQAAAGASVRVQVVDQKGLPVHDAVVELHSPRRPAGPLRFPRKVGMAQKSLQFTPGTLVVARGSTVAFPNLDQVRHSIYSFSKPARVEIDLYGRDQSRTQTFPIAGSVKLGCNIHYDMRRYIRVSDTPYVGKTDHIGYITLANITEGSVRLTVWHPQLRTPANELSSAFSVSGAAQTRKLSVKLR
ncbi:MAG: methylamine utilization protein [Erythrobacter sp.]